MEQDCAQRNKIKVIKRKTISALTKSAIEQYIFNKFQEIMSGRFEFLIAL